MHSFPTPIAEEDPEGHGHHDDDDVDHHHDDEDELDEQFRTILNRHNLVHHGVPAAFPVTDLIYSGAPRSLTKRES